MAARPWRGTLLYVGAAAAMTAAGVAKFAPAVQDTAASASAGTTSSSGTSATTATARRASTTVDGHGSTTGSTSDRRFDELRLGRDEHRQRLEHDVRHRDDRRLGRAEPVRLRPGVGHVHGQPDHRRADAAGARTASARASGSTSTRRPCSRRRSSPRSRRRSTPSPGRRTRPRATRPPSSPRSTSTADPCGTSRRSWGSRCPSTCATTTRAVAELVERAFEVLRAADRRFSRYDPDSEVSRYGRGELRPADLSDDLREVLALAGQAWEESGGAFSVRRPDGTLDTDGVVKGWAAQRAADVLADGGLRRFCLNAGGDVVVAGRARAGPRLARRHPRPGRRARSFLAVLELRDGAVATSGTYERGAHVWDGRTGQPATELVSASVVAADLTRADVLATSVMALGPGRRRTGRAQHGAVAVIAVDADGPDPHRPGGCGAAGNQTLISAPRVSVGARGRRDRAAVLRRDLRDEREAQTVVPPGPVVAGLAALRGEPVEDRGPVGAQPRTVVTDHDRDASAADRDEHLHVGVVRGRARCRRAR